MNTELSTNTVERSVVDAQNNVQYARCKVCGDREKYEGYEEMTEWDFGFDIEDERDLERNDIGDFLGVHFACIERRCVECGKEFESIEERFEHEDTCWLGDV